MPQKPDRPLTDDECRRIFAHCVHTRTWWILIHAPVTEDSAALAAEVDRLYYQGLDPLAPECLSVEIPLEATWMPGQRARVDFFRKDRMSPRQLFQIMRSFTIRLLEIHPGSDILFPQPPGTDVSVVRARLDVLAWFEDPADA